MNFSNLGISVVFNNTASGATNGAIATAIGTLNLTVSAGSTASLGFQIGASPTASGDSISIGGVNINTLDSDLSSLRMTGFMIVNIQETPRKP